MLVEREAALVGLVTAVDRSSDGAGQVVFVSGEAGVGKSALVAGLIDAVRARIAVRRGTCDNITTAAPLGAVLDAVPELAGLPADVEGPSRLMLYRRLRDILGSVPTLLVLEDVHWADEATLELLRYVGRRLDGVALLVVATFRDEALTRASPLASVVGDLVGAPGVSRIAVRPLSVAGVARLIELAGSDLNPKSLHRRTGGNAFYVTEVLAAGTDDVPPTVQQAVLARLFRLSAAAQRVLGAAAVLGQPADVTTLSAVSGKAGEAIDECVRSGMLVPSDVGCAFRHEIARLAVEHTLAPGERAALHRSAFAVLRGHAADDDRRLAHHAAGAADHPAVLEHASRAAARAARFGAHREAAHLYRLALTAAAADSVRRIALYEALSYECYLTDQLEEALTARRRALELFELNEDGAGVGASQRWLSRISWFLGRQEDSERYAAQSVAALEPLGDGYELAMAYSNLAQLRMLAANNAGAVEWGERGLAVARRIGEREVEMHALNNIGTALVQAGDVVEGERLLIRSLDLARADDEHAHVARAYTNLASAAVQQRRHADGQRALRAGIAYCIERDLESWRLYMTAWLARSLAEQGRLAEAESTAREVLTAPHLSPVTRVPAAAAAAQAGLRRGGHAGGLLDEALEIARATGEAQRLVPVASARAEAAWLAGRTDRIDAEIEHAWPAAAANPNPWELGELAWWSLLAGIERSSPVPVAEPFLAMLRGSWREAATWWEQAACPVWAAAALARSPDLDDARRGLKLAEECGATATAEALRRDRHAAGLGVPRGPRAVARSNPARLTAREIDVLCLVADGLSNADIAARLYLSEKTVGHHVSSVLRKLDEPNRGRAAAHAARLGILPPT